VLKVSISGFHQHAVRRRRLTQRRHLSVAALLAHISAVYAEHCGAYGWPRIWRALLRRGIRVGKQRVQRLMQRHGIRVRGKRRFRITTTDSRHDLPIAPNLLNRNFTVSRPNQAWSGNITYIATEEGWLFLAVVIDFRDVIEKHGILAKICSAVEWWAGRCGRTCIAAWSSTRGRWAIKTPTEGLEERQAKRSAGRSSL
jgi:hypothetical protein